MAVSHAEDVASWVKVLTAQQNENPKKLIDVQQRLKMPLVEVWIAALLGNFVLEQRGQFYETDEVWIG